MKKYVCSDDSVNTGLCGCRNMLISDEKQSENELKSSINQVWTENTFFPSDGYSSAGKTDFKGIIKDSAKQFELTNNQTPLFINRLWTSSKPKRCDFKGL